MKKSKIFIAVGLGLLAVLVVVFAILSAVFPVLDRKASAYSSDDAADGGVTRDDVIGAWVFNDPSTWVSSTPAFDGSSFSFSTYSDGGSFLKFYGIHFDGTVGLRFRVSPNQDYTSSIWSPIDDNSRSWPSLCISFTASDLVDTSVLGALHLFLTTVATRITADPVDADDYALIRFYNDSTLIRTCGYLVGFNIPSYFVPDVPVCHDVYVWFGLFDCRA